MIRSKRKAGIFAFIFALVLSFCSIVPITASNDSLDIPEAAVVVMREQCGAVSADIQFLSSIERDEKGCFVFPDNYGGRFVQDDILYICLTDLSETTCTIYESILEGYESNCQFIQVDYSYDELLDICQSTVDYLEQQKISIEECSIWQSKNKICIGVNGENYANAKNALSKRIKQYGRSSETAIELELTESSPAEEVTLYGGSTIYSSNAGAFTAGVCGTFRGSPAILTCGHGGQDVGDTIRYQNASGSVIGEVSYYNYSNNGTGDFEIITVTNENMNISGWINNVYKVYGVYPSPAEGVRLLKYGRASNLYATVVVDRENVTITEQPSGYKISGLTRCELISGSSQGGDSGGPYFLNYNGNVLFGGIHSAHLVTEDEDGNQIDYVYFTPWEYASNIGFSVEMG